MVWGWFCQYCVLPSPLFVQICFLTVSRTTLQEELALLRGCGLIKTMPDDKACVCCVWPSSQVLVGLFTTQCNAAQEQVKQLWTASPYWDRPFEVVEDE